MAKKKIRKLARLTRWRKSFTPEISQGKVAELVGVTRQQVNSWENAKHAPDSDNLPKIDKLIKCQTAYDIYHLKF